MGKQLLCQWIFKVKIEKWNGKVEEYDITEDEIKEKLLERKVFDLLKSTKLGIYKFKKEKHDNIILIIRHIEKEVCEKIYYESMKRALCLILTHCKKLDYYVLLSIVRGFLLRLYRLNAFGAGMMLNLEKEIIKKLAKDGGLI